MLTAMVAIENILAGITSKDNFWQVTGEQEYHEHHVVCAGRGVAAIGRHG